MPISNTPEGIRVDYTEPSITKTGTPLTDLSLTSIFYDAGQGPVKAVDVPASSPNGGGLVSQVITVPIGLDQEIDVQVWLTATDLSGNESEKSAVLTLRIDTLPPAAPVLNS